MGKFIFTQTEIPGVVVIEPQVFGDDRGYFMETYQKDQFAEAGIDKEFVQDNQSRSTRGVLRGLHFQKNHTQGKLVRVTKGEVYDVAVDCRPHSATFGKWVGVTLSEDNKKMFYIPEPRKDIQIPTFLTQYARGGVIENGNDKRKRG